MRTILVIDDDPLILKCFELALAGEGIELRSAMTAAGGLRDFQEHRPDAVISDVRLPDRTGLELLADLKGIDPKVPVIIMTGQGTAETAIEAMRRGAFDYLLKPIDPDRLDDLVARVLDVSRLMRQAPRVAAADDEETTGEDLFIGRSPAMQEVFKTIGRVAPTDAAVLILGESGTGKELVARAIYHFSRREQKPFLAINCAAIPETLLESELFGHEKGSFTGAERKRVGKFEQCDGGTIFLDEIGDMTPLTQAKILRVLQDGQYERVGGNTVVKSNVRIIAATSRNLEAMILAGTFREDLYYRLNVCTIRLPALRDRREDLPLLIRHFLRRGAAEFEKTVDSVSPEAMAALETCNWPGNVRQLQSAIKRALLNAQGPILTPDALPIELRSDKQSPPNERPAGGELTLFIRERLAAGSTNLHAELLDRVERELLLEVLRAAKGNLSRSSTILGITRPTLRSKLHHLGINVESVSQVTEG